MRISLLSSLSNMIATKPEELENLRVAGALLSDVLHALRAMVRPGITTADLDIAAEEKIRAGGGMPAFLNYRAGGSSYPYPATLCASVNDEVVHSIPSEAQTLVEGDLISLDLGLSYEGYFVDSALTMTVGEPDAASQRFMDATREALSAGISQVRAGGRIGDIGAAVEAVAKKYGYAVVEELGGHATGKAVHEKPFVPNTGVKGEGEKLLPGMVLAIEPIFSEGSPNIEIDEDDWTYRTADGSRAAHFEQTILVTKEGCEILTPLR